MVFGRFSSIVLRVITAGNVFWDITEGESLCNCFVCGSFCQDSNRIEEKFNDSKNEKTDFN